MQDYQPISHQRQQLNKYHDFMSLQNPYAQPLQQMNYNSQGHNPNNNPQISNQENPQLLAQSELRHVNDQMNVLENDIVQNNKEIRLLNNKITKSDFQQAQLKKLFEKQQKLIQKRLQFQDILKNHQYLKYQMMQNKLKQSQIKHSLGRQYQNIVQEKKRNEKQQKQRQNQQESTMISYNNQAIMYERERKRQLLQQQKRQAQQELKQRQYLRELQRQQKLKQKQQYNQVLSYRNQLETQKDHVYKQYYNHFAQEQDKLQNIYKNRVMESETLKEKQRMQSQKRNYETFQMRIGWQNEQKLRKITQEKQMLKTFLQSQMQETNRKKYRQREDELKYQNQVKSYQVNMNQYDYMQKEKKKDLQRRYDTQLAAQIQLKNRLTQQGVNQAFRSSSLGMNQRMDGQGAQRRTHNPVTNPIDFKIGITNPYVIREYQNTKEKYMGDNNLKLRNLAMIGNNSLINEKR